MIQNSDIKVRLTLTDGTNPYTISALNAYEVYAYHVYNGVKTLFATYKNTNTGIYGIVVNDSANGKIDIVLNREKTRTLAEGKIYLEVRVQLSVGSEFIASKQNVGATGIEIDTNYISANPNSLT